MTTVYQHQGHLDNAPVTFTVNPDGTGSLSEVWITQDYLQCMFKLADTDGNGTLDKYELAQVLFQCQASGDLNLTPQRVMKVMKAADTNNDNKIDYSEVMHLDGKAIEAERLCNDSSQR